MELGCRTLGLLAAACLDDDVVDIAATSQQVKLMNQQTFSALGTPPKESKSFPMLNHRAFLDPVIDLGTLRDEKARGKSPTGDCESPACIGRWNHGSSPGGEDTRKKNSVGTGSFGRLGDLGWRSSSICIAIPQDWNFVEHSAKRTTFSSRSDDQHAAETQKWSMRHDSACDLLRCWMTAKSWFGFFVRNRSSMRKRYRHLIRRDVIWFTDKKAAAAAATSGSSVNQRWIHVQLARFLCLRLKCRIWIDRIDSKSNRADVLSRRGLLDEWTCSQGCHFSECQHPPWDGDTNAPDGFNALWHGMGFVEVGALDSLDCSSW